MMRRFFLAAGLFGCAASVLAAETGSPLGEISFSREEPVVLSARRLDYDEGNGLIIAEGEVEVTQGGTIVLADMLTYDQQNNIILAQGNVSVLEPSGNVYFAQEVELTDRMQKGEVGAIRARMADNSLFAANEADRLSEEVTVLHQAVYSPCAIKCADGTPKEPLWQVRADKATIDRAEQTVTYRDAYMDVMGVPVIYTPYLSHAMPGADSKSGLLTPQLKSDDNLGNVVIVPMYWAIAPDRDATITPMYTSEEGPVLMGEYRQRFDMGSMKLSGSVTQPDDRDALGNLSDGSNTRGHFFGQGEFTVTPDWQWGFDVRRTTDDTYLRRYDITNDALLTSRIYGEGFDFAGPDARSYIVAQGLAFQGLQQQDDTERSPLVLPQVDVFYQSAPMAWNSRVSLTGGVMALARDLGADSRRASVTGEWMLPFVSEGGHIFELSTSLRADAYDIDNFALGDGSIFNGRETRVIPQAMATWRYPLINRFADSALVVEPIVSAIASPDSGNSNKIPNEDSAVPEFTDVNLFSDNRFAGYDRVETGPRLNYGVRSQWQFSSDKLVQAMIGQAYRTNDDPLFPISNDLRSRFSDYVGKVAFTYAPFDISYRFRTDKDNFEFKRSEVTASMWFERFGLGVNYLNLANDPVLGEREEISGGSSIRLSENWSWQLGAHRDLNRGEFISTTTGLTFQNECLTVLTTAGKNYTSDRDFQESNSFTMRVLLKNLN